MAMESEVCRDLSPLLIWQEDVLFQQPSGKEQRIVYVELRLSWTKLHSANITTSYKLPAYT